MDSERPAAPSSAVESYMPGRTISLSSANPRVERQQKKSVGGSVIEKKPEKTRDERGRKGGEIQRGTPSKQQDTLQFSNAYKIPYPTPRIMPGGIEGG
jgi:hypothetical protein